MHLCDARQCCSILRSWGTVLIGLSK